MAPCRIRQFERAPGVARGLLAVATMLSDRLFGLFSSDLAIDLGTANTWCSSGERGIVPQRASIIAINRTDNEVIGSH
jgi:hypothetical protein